MFWKLDPGSITGWFVIYSMLPPFIYSKGPSPAHLTAFLSLKPPSPPHPLLFIQTGPTLNSFLIIKVQLPPHPLLFFQTSPTLNSFFIIKAQLPQSLFIIRRGQGPIEQFSFKMFNVFTSKSHLKDLKSGP